MKKQNTKLTKKKEETVKRDYTTIRVTKPTLKRLEAMKMKSIEQAILTLLEDKMKDLKR